MRNIVITAISLLAMVLLMSLRTPEIFLKGRIWADDGDLLALATMQPWYKVLVAPQHGYYAVFANLAAIIAAQFPIDYFHIPLLLMSIIIPFFTILLLREVLGGGNNIGWNCVLVCSVLLAPGYKQETWLNVTSLQYFTAAWGGFLILRVPEKGKPYLYFGALLAGFSGPTIFSLIPAYILKYFIDKNKIYMYLLYLLLPGFCYFMYIQYFTITPPRVSFDFFDSWLLFLSRQITAQILSPIWAEHFILSVKNVLIMEWFDLAFGFFSILYLVSFIVVIYFSKIKSALWGAVAFILLVIPGLVGPLYVTHPTLTWPAFAPLYGERYALAAGIVMIAILLLIAKEGKSLLVRRGASGLLLWLLVARAIDYYPPPVAAFPNHFSPNPDFVPFHTGPSWPKQIRKFKSGETDILIIWPWWSGKLERCAIDASCKKE